MPDYAKLFIQRLVDIAQTKELSETLYAKMKNDFSAEFKVPNLSNIELSEKYREMVQAGDLPANQGLQHLLARRKVRSQSGVAVITCQTKPFPCPGQCIYCPSEPNMPKSYLILFKQSTGGDASGVK
ncbi:MAG TPA: hypothetical protein PLQ36_02885 [Candidatus Gracilibacteria bacterium]|nr:hypothetical protein [Candidatus Gracilibacteria bacterium]